MSSYRLKECSAEKINKLVYLFDRNSKYYTDTEYNRIYQINIDHLAYGVVNKYTINDCISLITANGDFLDCIKKSIDVQLDMSDPLKFHRQLATPYVKEWITDKINLKLFLLRQKQKGVNKNDENICSICLDCIPSSKMKITKCKHLFHRECLNKWTKNTCPMCRNNL